MFIVQFGPKIGAGKGYGSEHSSTKIDPVHVSAARV